MFELVRRAVEIPAVSGRWVWACASIATFAFLLAQDAVHPLIVFGVELFLAF